MNNKDGIYRQDIISFAKEHFDTDPEYLWSRYPNYAVLRHSSSQKWYAVIMDVPKVKLGLNGEEKVDVLEIKCTPLMSGSLLLENGILPAYHMKKGNWISVLLDGSVNKEHGFALLQMSYDMTNINNKQKERTVPREWIVPANPKYYDFEQAFNENDTILWKQSSNVIVGDTIFLYAASPYSAILYQCEAVEVNIPYSYDSDELHIHKVMKIKLIHQFEKNELTFHKLKEFGVFSVRGPRSVPDSLSREIQKITSLNKNQL